MLAVVRLLNPHLDSLFVIAEVELRLSAVGTIVRHQSSPLSLRMRDTTSLNISFGLLYMFARFAVIACSSSADGAIIARPYTV